MRELLTTLSTALGQICPTFVHVPPQTVYPYITLEPKQVLEGFPAGSRVMLVSIKIWSRYKGTQEILKLAKEVEGLLQNYAPQTFKVSVKILESTLVFLEDGNTRLHTIQIKMRSFGYFQ